MAEVCQVLAQKMLGAERTAEIRRLGHAVHQVVKVLFYGAGTAIHTGRAASRRRWQGRRRLRNTATMPAR